MHNAFFGGLHISQLERNKLVKQAYYAPPVYTSGERDEEDSGVPWGKLALLGLLGAGGAYAYGKAGTSAPNAIKGFAQGVDNNIVNPIKGFAQKHHVPGFAPPVEDEAAGLTERANNAAFGGQFKDIKHLSQLHGTQFDIPDKQNDKFNHVARAVGTAGLGGMVGSAVNGGLGYFAPAAAASIPGRALGAGAAGLNAVSSAGAPLFNVVPNKQIAQKLSDHLGVKNHLGREALSLGVMGASSVLPGGPLVRALAPGLVNGFMNTRNRNNMLANGMQARAGELKNSFQEAVANFDHGNKNPLKAWYQSQSPAALKMTIDQFKKDPELQKQMTQYSSNI